MCHVPIVHRLSDKLCVSPCETPSQVLRHVLEVPSVLPPGGLYMFVYILGYVSKPGHAGLNACCVLVLCSTRLSGHTCSHALCVLMLPFVCMHVESQGQHVGALVYLY